MDKWFKAIGLVCLFVFSVFYTDKVVTIVRSRDPIMVQINEYSKEYNIKAVNATINDKEMVPGVDGCMIDANKSYYNMKRFGYYNVNMIEYKEIKPKLTMDNIYNKYITKGNKDKNEVTLIFKLHEGNYMNNILAVLNERKVNASFFVDGKWMETNTELVAKLVRDSHEVYNLGYDNQYDPDLLVWTNKFIESVARNKSNYCLVLKDNQKVLDLCSKNKMHTIKSEIVIDIHNTFTSIKDKIEKGSIIIYDVNNTTSTELTNTIVFLNKKGFQYNLLSSHLSEKRCNETSN